MTVAIKRVIRWFLHPAQNQPDEHMPILEASFDPETVSDLLDKSEQRRSELLDWSNQLDHKLLAVITAGGVYVAILVSIRNSIPILAVVLVGLVAAVSLLLAFLAWRPHPHATIPIDRFASNLHIDPHDLRWLLIAAHSGANLQIHELNEWKAQKLSLAAACLSVSSLSTIYTVLGGPL